MGEKIVIFLIVQLPNLTIILLGPILSPFGNADKKRVKERQRERERETESNWAI